MKFALAATLSAIGMSMVSAQQSSLVRCLENIGTGSLVSNPSESTFAGEALGTNYRFVFSPNAIFYPKNEQHVQEGIKCAKAANVPVAPRSGAHSYEGYSQGGQDGALLMDLYYMKDVSVNAGASTAVVGPGNRLGKLYLDLWKNGRFSFPGGSCPTVGISGFLLGGGQGYQTQKYGMGADNVAEMRMVDANGEVKIASATQNSDLFFALLGAGGGSYGVVTSFTLNIQRHSSNVVQFYYSWPAAQSAKVLTEYTKWAKAAPADLTSGAMLSTDGELSVYGMYLGNRRQARSSLGLLLNQVGTQPDDEYAESMSIIRAHHAMSEMPGNNIEDLADFDKDFSSRYWKSSGLNYPSGVLRDSTMQILTTCMSQASSQDVYAAYSFEYYAGDNSKARSPAFTNSFIHRSGFTLQVFTSWGGADSPTGRPDCQECISWQQTCMRQLTDNYVQEFGSQPTAYQNYIDRNLENWQEAYYGNGFNRLVQIKAKYDPDNRFNFPQSIPVS